MRHWQDAIGTAHTTVKYGSHALCPRIVSLVPSLTELVCDLGLASYLVGRTGFCIHPKAVVQNIPKVGGTKSVNIEKIRRLAPTHLIVNIDENEKPCVEQLAQFIPHVIVTHPQTLEDNLAVFQLLGGIFDVNQRAQQLSQQLLDAIALLKQSLTNPLQQKRVLYCIWKDPWMTVSASTYIANMLSHIGWQIVAVGDKRYPEFVWSQQLVDQLDSVLLSSEPYRFTEADATALEQQLAKPVMLVDGEMLSWYGSRSIKGVNYLRSLLIDSCLRSLP